jgi:hypothetical protein
MYYHREEPREEAKAFITVEGHDIYGHEKLEALITDVSYSGLCLHTEYPFEVNSVINIYMAGDLIATGEVANVAVDDTEKNSAIKVRIGIELTKKYDAWPYSHPDLEKAIV